MVLPQVALVPSRSESAKPRLCEQFLPDDHGVIDREASGIEES